MGSRTFSFPECPSRTYQSVQYFSSRTVDCNSSDHRFSIHLLYAIKRRSYSCRYAKPRYVSELTIFRIVKFRPNWSLLVGLSSFLNFMGLVLFSSTDYSRLLARIAHDEIVRARDYLTVLLNRSRWWKAWTLKDRLCKPGFFLSPWPFLPQSQFSQS